MTLTGFARASKLGLKNYWRNGWLSLAATLVVMLMLFTISVFTIQSMVIYRTTESLKQKIDLVIFFSDDASNEQIQALRQVLANRVDVNKVEYISKEQAFEVFRSRNVSDQIKQLVTPEDNPLPRSLRIHATDPEQLETISVLLERSDYQSIIRRKNDDDETQKRLIQNLSETSRLTRRNGLILSGIFFLIAILMVFNTARIVITARKNEIEIMRLVGSTEGFIRWPFILEGMLYGILGALTATGMIFVFLKYDLASATPLISITGILGSDMFNFFLRSFWLILFGQISVGILVSIIATLAAINRKVKL